jgi:hypothetical protein
MDYLVPIIVCLQPRVSLGGSHSHGWLVGFGLWQRASK